MSGHNKWSTIKHKKAKEDAKRGAVFTRHIKEITLAAREGGGDPEMNPRLRRAIDAAKASNMPNDNVTRAIKRGTGELEGVTYEEMTYEGYGPGGVAVLVEVVTDNKNRAVAEIRHLFTKYNGNLGETGCVNWMFDKKGYISIEKEKATEEQVMEPAIEAGGEDIRDDGDYWAVVCEPDAYDDVKQAIEGAGIEIAEAELTMLPQTTVELDEKGANSMLKLIDALEENEDIQNVYANFDISDEIMEQLSA